jgi:fibronectin type 3 domain-containing protein
LRYLAGFVCVCMFSLMVLSGVSEAAGPSWAGGFPKLSQKNALLQWSPVKGATAYNVYRSSEKDKNLKLIKTVKANHYVDPGLTAGKTFYYYVSAVVGGSEGERSAAGVVGTAAEKVFVPMKVPTLLAAHVKDQPGGAVAVGILWEGAVGTDLVGINVYRSTAKGKDYALVGSSQTDTYIDNDVKKGETYYYVVTAVDSQFKETKYSNEVSVNVPAPAVAKTAVGAAPAQAEKAQNTEMKKARLLFRLPKEQPRDPEFLPKRPVDATVDNAVGHLYVASYGYGGVLVYNMDGELQFGIRKDGVSGKEKFTSVRNVLVGENGNLYVTDFSSPEIRVFDFTGKPVETITVDASYIPEMKGLKARLFGIAQTKDGTLYVGDPITANRIHVLGRDRKRIRDITGYKKGKVDFNGPTFMVIAKNDDLVFIDSGFSRLMVFGEDGKFKRTISQMGTMAGDLSYPVGLANGKGGELFVASANTPNVQAFSVDGKFLYALCNEKADGPLDIAEVTSMSIDGQDRLYVTEGLINRVSVFQLIDGLVEVVPPKSQ